MSDFFIKDKMNLLTQLQFDALDKVVKMFGRTTKSIFNPQITPKAIGLPSAWTNISFTQAHMTRTRFGHGRPWRGEDTMVSLEDNMTKPSTTTETSTKYIAKTKKYKGKTPTMKCCLKMKASTISKGF